ncbi:MAG: HEPN domain-containing protein [Candidatus Nanopelagicales bacterium]|nr:HEPN domain-containing protein [Candidatus Nanopelagicales bacterium]MDD2819031.1 HEPN domain-containing protein [Candidatus Nanopelagicales bacterium]
MTDPNENTLAAMASQPSRPEMWKLALPAIRDVIRAIEDYLADPGWVPRLSDGTLTWSNRGWPSVSTPVIGPQDGRIDYAALIGKGHRPIDATSFESVRNFVAFVLADPTISPRLKPAMDGVAADTVTYFAGSLASALPIDIATHSMTIGLTAEDDLRDLYCQIERYWLAPTLSVDYVVPLVLTALDGVDPIEVTASTRLVRMDDDMLHARAMAGQMNVLDPVPSPITGAATHALVIGTFQRDNQGPLEAMISRRSLDLDDVLSEADLACESLRILGVKVVGYASVFLVPRDFSSGWHRRGLPELSLVKTMRRYPEILDNYGWLADIPAFPMRWLDGLPTVASALAQASPRVRLASRRLTQSMLRSDELDRLLDACIGIEALVGGDDNNEITHRLAQRVGVALATSRTADGRRRSLGSTDLDKVYETMKAVYSDRSKVVHGTTHVPKTRDFRGELIPTHLLAGDILRYLLIEALDRPDEISGKKLDQRLLHGATRDLAEYSTRIKASEGTVARAAINASGRMDEPPLRPHPDRADPQVPTSPRYPDHDGNGA